MSPSALTGSVYVAGHRGLVGSAVMRQLAAIGHSSVVTRTHEELDLTDGSRVADFFRDERPDHVFLCAAKVGGILGNSVQPADFIRENLEIQTHVIHEAWRNGVKRLLFLGSSCIYPRDCPQPMREEHLLTGPLEPTNRAYAVAKIAGIELCWSYNRQHGTSYLAVMPTNLFGPGDNYDLATSHVLPALMRKMHEARESGEATVEVWGTGSPRREFLFSDDMAEACVFLMGLPDERFAALTSSTAQPPLVNVGCGEDMTIAELAGLVADVVGFTGELRWNTSRPDGTPRKLLDVSRLTALGWRPRTSIRDGIRVAYEDFLRHGAGR